MHDSIVGAVISKIMDRSLKGQIEYKTTMDREDMSKLEWLKLAQEEAMDMAIYLEKLIRLEKH